MQNLYKFCIYVILGYASKQAPIEEVLQPSDGFHSDQEVL